MSDDDLVEQEFSCRANPPSVVMGFQCAARRCTTKAFHEITSDEWFGKKALKKFVPEGWSVYMPKGLLARAYCPWHTEFNHAEKNHAAD